MKLKSIQQSFIQQLTHTQSADDFLDYLKPCGLLLPEQQLAIYQNNVRGALQNSLAQVYPVCRKILGENYFKQLARVYIKKHPSKQSDLNSYGEHFSDFLADQCQQRNELTEFSYLSDLAQLEWFYQHVYYVAEADVFDFSAFSQLNEQQQALSVFQLAPCLKFIHSDYPILSLWQMNKADTNSHQSLESKPESCCVFRKNNQIELFAIDADMHGLLTLIATEKTLEELTLLGYDKQLPELIKLGWINRFKVKYV